MSDEAHKDWARLKAKPGVPEVTDLDVDLATSQKYANPDEMRQTQQRLNQLSPFANEPAAPTPTSRDQRVVTSLRENNPVPGTITEQAAPDEKRNAVLRLLTRIREGSREKQQQKDVLRRIISKVEEIPTDYERKVAAAIDAALVILSASGVENRWDIIQAQLSKTTLTPPVRREIYKNLMNYRLGKITEAQLRNYNRYKPQVVPTSRELGM